MPRTSTEIRYSCVSLHSQHRWRFRASSNQATLPHYGFSCETNRTNITLPTKQSTELLRPEAAVAPALSSGFDSKVTLLGQVTARVHLGMCCLPASHTLQSMHASIDFPLRKQKLGVSLPSEFSPLGTVSLESYWQALPYLFGWAFRS